MLKHLVSELKEAVLCLQAGQVTLGYPFQPHAPEGNFRGKVVVDTAQCIGCGACAAVCPTGAIEIEDRAGERVLITWNTVVPLKPCPECGQPYAPEPTGFLRGQVAVSAELWGICPACRRKKAAAQIQLSGALAADRIR